MVLPVNTLVAVTLLDEISTASIKPDDFFELRVKDAVLIGGRVAIPEKARAVGQVIDSQPGRMGGAAAKLLITVRYVEVNGQRIPMRLHRPSSGTDKTMGSLALSFGFGFAGLLLKGGNVVLPAGTEMMAKVAKDTPIQALPSNPAAIPLALPDKAPTP